MKMLVHREAVSEAPPYSLSDIKLYLRVEHFDEDMAIQSMARTAALDLEDFAQIALLTQTIRVVIFDPVSQEYGFRLPIGPVAMNPTVTVTIDGEPFTAFQVEGGKHPYLRWSAAYYDLQPCRIVIEYQAGFGASAANIPADLSQALRDQVALLYDMRSPVSAKTMTSSPHMARIGARYRGVSM